MSALCAERVDLGDPAWELVDPTPNVHALFIQFDAKFFMGRLVAGAVAVRWSKRMYSCAGICRYEGGGGLCEVALSEPLLKLRPRKDLVETLLHEMIHAFLFLTDRDRDRDGHGPNFQRHMHRINAAANLNISIFHNFHDEVKLYQTHWWRCNGPCQTQKPYFGIVRRTCNRAPGPNDFWWSNHKANCGGEFIKFKEPEKKQKTSAPKSRPSIGKNVNIKTAANIKTIADLPSTCNKPKGGTKANSGSTVIINDNKGKKLPKSTVNQIANQNTLIDSWSGKGNKLKSGASENSDNTSLQTVRDHWANKELDQVIPNTGKKNKNNKRMSAGEDTAPPAKVNKIDKYFPNVTNPPNNFSKKDAESLLKEIYGEKINLLKSNESNLTTPSKLIAITVSKKGDKKEKNKSKPYFSTAACKKGGISNEANNNMVPMLSGSDEGDQTDLVVCPSCHKRVNSSQINDHLDDCLNAESNTKNLIDLTETTTEASRPCPVCDRNIAGPLADHLEVCLVGFETDISENCPSTSSASTSRIDNVSLVSEDKDDDLDESRTYNESGTMHPCPCCLLMVEADLMNRHIDECLNRVYLEGVNKSQPDPTIY